MEARDSEGQRLLRRLGRLPLGVVQTLVKAVPMAVDGYYRHRLPLQAAGIAYRVLFSLAPLAIVLVSVAGMVLKDDTLREELTERVVSWLPVSESGSDQVEAAITRLASPSGALGLVSIALFAWAATGMMAALRTGLETAFEVDQRRPVVRGKLVDLLLVVLAGVLVIAAIAAAFVAQVVTRLVDQFAETVGYGGSVVQETARVLVPLAVSIVVVMLIYRFVPSRRIGTTDALAGAVVTGLLFSLISLGSAYIYDQVASLSVIYGSITVVLVFLYSMYLYASAILFGGEVAAAWSRPAEPTTGSFRERVRGMVTGLFVAPKEPELPSPTVTDPDDGSA